MFHIYFDCFCGTDLFKTVNIGERPAQNQQLERHVGLYMLSNYLELMIKNCMLMLSELPQKLDTSHYLYEKDLNIHSFLLKILRYIFRAIKLKEEGQRSSKSYASELVMFLQRHVLRLILVVMKLSITNYYPMDYLYLLKLIFKAVRTSSFSVYFNTQVKEKELRIVDYFIQLYKSNIEELKIIATEIVFSMPIDLAYSLSKYPDSAKDMIQMITFALTLTPSEIILKALQILDHIISSASLLKDDVLILLFEKTAGDLIHNLNNLIFSFTKRSYFMRPSNSLEVSAIPFSFKIIARFATFMRNLNIPINFRVNDDFVVDMEKQEERREKEKAEKLMEEIDSRIFELEIDDGSKKFTFNTMQTLISVFQTLETLKSKPTNYIYINVSPNLFFMSTIKHQIGLHKLYKFLKHMFNILLFTKNNDIERYYSKTAHSTQDRMDEENNSSSSSEGTSPHNARMEGHIRNDQNQATRR